MVLYKVAEIMSKIIEKNNVVGLFTRLVGEKRRNSKLVINFKTLYEGDFSKKSLQVGTSQ